MIKNERQLAATNKQLDLLNQALDGLRAAGEQDALSLAQVGALEADAASLERQISEFTAIRRGELDLAPLAAIHRMGKALVHARIASNLTQEELALMLGQKPQQIQRYERTQYSSASLSTLERVADVISARIPDKNSASSSGSR